MVLSTKEATKTLFYHLETFGCQMNVNDSEYLSGQLEEMGYVMTRDINIADLIILNTCCVRAKVEQKIYSRAGIISKIKKFKPYIIFGICGCMAQKGKEMIKKRVPAVDLIFGPSQITSVQKLLENFKQNKRRKTTILCDNKESFQLASTPIKHQSSITAYLQIMKGCNNFCSYCIVPYVRGPEESRPAEEILLEIESLAQKNFKEIMLLGQNVNSYGYDLNLKTKENFLTLLSKVNNIKNIERIRFITSHPKDFNLDLVKVIEKHPKICEHIHLPLQSGSDTILKKMNRKYNMEQYYNIINNIKEHIPGASISSDIMVGFPGETERDFEETIQALKNIGFDSVYSFIYSNREGTLSPFLGKDVPLETKKKRLWTLLDIQKDIANQKNRYLIGETVEILVESSSKKGIEKQYWGKTRTNKVAVFTYPYQEDLLGRLVNVKIQNADAYTLYGELINGKLK
ncbi:MAG TPA: tRNA (N6-isopentenyl adenosine(37)-C2)-methylthiotransferase MiaB [Atribacterota bacterium]|nr:tRNA (N6-isopentenyl adenosine(37)-C2)-methylthiotransferase MiaB [Atribacterota bacterium]